MFHEDLCSKLQMALLQQQVNLRPVDVSCSTESHRALESYDDCRLKFIQSILDDDADLQDDKLTSEQVLNSKVLSELTEIVSSSSSSSTPSNSSSSSSSPSLPPTSRVSDPANLDGLLLSMAQAVEAKNAVETYKLAEELKRIISLDEESPVFRAAGYFINALVARLRGYGAQMCRIMSQEVTKRQIVAMEINLPIIRATEFFANQNQTILEACQGAQRIHIVDYGILYGCQWPSLIKALSERAQGPPKTMMITGIEITRLAYPILDQARASLIAYAKSCGIPLQFQPVASDSWEKAEPLYQLSADEFLVINCKMRMRHLRDGTAVESPRRVFFRNIAKLKPALFVMCCKNSDLSSPFFIHRFQEAWKDFRNRTEQFHETMKVVDPSTLEFLHKLAEMNVMNIVACEGADWTERMASYKTWNALATKAGFEKVAISEQALQIVNAVWSGHEKHTYAMDGEWLLLGWGQVTLNAMSAWRLRKSFQHLKGG